MSDEEYLTMVSIMAVSGVISNGRATQSETIAEHSWNIAKAMLKLKQENEKEGLPQ